MHQGLHRKAYTHFTYGEISLGVGFTLGSYLLGKGGTKIGREGLSALGSKTPKIVLIH